MVLATALLAVALLGACSLYLVAFAVASRRDPMTPVPGTRFAWLARRFAGVHVTR